MSFGVIAKTPDVLQQINQITNGPLTYNSHSRFAIQCQDESYNEEDCPSDFKDYLPKMDDVYEYFSSKGYPEPKIRTIRILDSVSSNDALTLPNIQDNYRARPYLINYAPNSGRCVDNEGVYVVENKQVLICSSTDFLKIFVHEYFHALQYALTEKENGSTPTSEWILEGSATVAAKTYQDRVLFPHRLVRDSRYNPPRLDKPLMAFSYSAQDFFVFAGQKTETHVEELKYLFPEKRLHKGLDAGLSRTTYDEYGLKGMYWQFVRNEAYEKKVQITSGPSIINRCTPSEDRFNNGIPEYSPSDNKVIFKLARLSSKMVKVSFLDFGSNGQGGSIRFYPQNLPPGFRYIVYKEGENGCENKTDSYGNALGFNFNELESGATHNFYILMSNTNYEPLGIGSRISASVTWEETHY